MTLRLCLTLLATCGILGAVVDGAGVTVDLNGAEVLHRSAIAYVDPAMQNRVEGVVTVQLRLDARSAVSDAEVLSGPDEFRKAVLGSVLDWHFAPEFAGTTRTVNVTFAIPQPRQLPTMEVYRAQTRPPAPLRAPRQPGGRVLAVQAAGLPDRAASEILARMPVGIGDEWSTENQDRALKAVQAYDEHLSIQAYSAEGDSAVTLYVTTPGQQIPGAPQRIRVGGNVQSAMILRRVMPVYPPDAKAAHIQGRVQLSVMIGESGAIDALTVTDGPPDLRQSAVDAVSQWVYRPTLLNGSQVQVETTVDVNYTLSQ